MWIALVIVGGLSAWVSIVGVIIVLQRRSAAATIAWLFALAFLPIIGLLIYRLIGPSRLERKRLKRHISRRAVDGMTSLPLPAAKGVDVFLGVLDRRSIANLRLGVDVSRSFAVGNVAFQRSEVLAARVFAARELKSGRGEWEAEVGYSTTKDVTGGSAVCSITAVDPCFGSSNGKILSLGGNLVLADRHALDPADHRTRG